MGFSRLEPAVIGSTSQASTNHAFHNAGTGNPVAHHTFRLVVGNASFIEEAEYDYAWLLGIRWNLLPLCCSLSHTFDHRTNHTHSLTLRSIYLSLLLSLPFDTKNFITSFLSFHNGLNFITFCDQDSRETGNSTYLNLNIDRRTP
jgi:hypothetical protein